MLDNPSAGEGEGESAPPFDRKEAMIGLVARQLGIEPAQVTEDTELGNVSVDFVTGVVIFKEGREQSISQKLYKLHTVRDLMGYIGV